MLYMCLRNNFIIKNKRIAAYKLMLLAGRYSGLANANITSGFTEMVSCPNFLAVKETELCY